MDPILSIAHIRHGEHVFQILVYGEQEDGSIVAVDWDEAATRAAYEAWLASNP